MYSNKHDIKAGEMIVCPKNHGPIVPDSFMSAVPLFFPGDRKESAWSPPSAN